MGDTGIVFIVSRQDTQMVEYLRSQFSDVRDVVDIVLDRRVNERRRCSMPTSQERRRGERRQHDVTRLLKGQGWAVFRR